MQICRSTRSVIVNAMATQYTLSFNDIYRPHWLVQWSRHCSHMCIPVSLAARLHQCHAKDSRYINNDWTFSRQTSYRYVCVCVQNFGNPRNILYMGYSLRGQRKGNLTSFLKKWWWCPGCCGWVDWMPACEPKGCKFDTQSGHMPGLQARSLAGGM